jgi:hypothetical protein
MTFSSGTIVTPAPLVSRKRMPVQFESGDLDDDEVLDRCELLLDLGDIVRLDGLRERLDGEIVVRQALVGLGKTQQRMLVFGHVAPDRTTWKGTLTALKREAGT